MTAYSDLVGSHGAICHLPLDGTQFPDASFVDTTGHGTDATIAGSVQIWDAPGLGPIAGEGRISFFSRGWLDLAHPEVFPVAGPLSYEVWMRGSGLAEIDALWQVEGAGTPNPLIDTALDGTLANLRLGNAHGAYIFGTTLDNDPWPWSHVVWVSDGVMGAIYVNGLLLTDDQSSGTRPLDNDAAWIASGVRLGATLGGSNELHGSLGHAAVYPLALTPCQIGQHYDLATTGSYGPCVRGVRLTLAPGAGAVRLRVRPGTTERLTINA